MAVLSLVGCGPRLELGLSAAAGVPPSLIVLAGPKPRNELIVAAVDLLVRAAGSEVGELKGIAVTRGPGSFTGLRVTLATAQALALASGLRAHGFPSLLVQAARTDLPSCLAVQPARRGVYYAQRFSRGREGLRSDGEVVLLDAASLAAAGVPVVAPDGVAIPEGTHVAAPALTSAEALLVLYANLESPDPATLVPLYVEPPAATPPRRPTPPWQPFPTES